jgi:tRNA A37 threonylcarbamoyltransferase TsaD
MFCKGAGGGFTDVIEAATTRMPGLRAAMEIGALYARANILTSLPFILKPVAFP